MEKVSKSVKGLNLSEVEPNILFHPVKHERHGIEFLVALSDIKAGTILWKEKPLMIGPPLSCPHDLSSCSGCYKIKPQSELRKCSYCNWPVCSKECEKIPEHAQNECKYKIPFNQNISSILSNHALLVYRLINLKRENPTVWEEVTTFSPFPGCGKQNRLAKILGQHGMKEEMRFFSIETLTNVDEFNKVDDLMYNCLGLSGYYAESMEGRTRYAKALYKNTCRMMHSCIPNCGVVAKLPPSNEITVYAAVDIKKGEHLTRFWRDYFGEEQFGGVFQRRRVLQVKHFPFLNFVCDCLLCSNPNDNGVNLSTLICPKCKESSLLPVPQQRLENWIWKCKKRGCNVSRTFLDLEKLCEEIYAPVRFVVASFQAFQLMSGRWPTLRDKFSDRIHRNFWAKVEAAETLLRQYVEIPTCKPPQPPLDSLDWKYMEEICNYLLPIFDEIRPGISSQRAYIQHILAKNYLRELEYTDLRGMNHSTETLKNAKKKLAMATEYCEEALKYFYFDPETPKLKELEKMKDSCREILEEIRKKEVVDGVMEEMYKVLGNLN